MNTLLALIQSRRSIRRYAPRAISLEQIHTLLEAGRWSPSAHNRQPWRWVVIQSLQTKIGLATAMGARLRADLSADNAPPAIIEADVSRSYDRITKAPLLLLLCLTLADMDTYPDPKRAHNEMLMAVQSTAMAGQNMLLMAHALGLGACWMCAPLFCPDVVQNALNLPSDWVAQALITIGFPAEEKSKPRKSIEDLTLYK
ncbi:MAG: nitroreductase family protein [Phototrophicales bacterium]|nr:nitroreductase family protein [Phototrophicales bacterium]